MIIKIGTCGMGEDNVIWRLVYQGLWRIYREIERKRRKVKDLWGEKEV